MAQTTTVTRTSSLTKVIIGVAFVASAGAVTAAALSTKISSPGSKALTPPADISVLVEVGEPTTLDYRSGDSTKAAVVIRNNGAVKAKNVSTTLEYDGSLQYSSINPAAHSSGTGVKSYGCTGVVPDVVGMGGLSVEYDETVGTVTCIYDIPAGVEAEFTLNFEVNPVFTNCGTDDSDLAALTATATYGSDPTQSNNTDEESIEVEPLTCPEVSIEVSVADDSTMIYADSVRTATVSITNHDTMLDLYVKPINVFAYGGLRFENIEGIDDVRENEEDDDYLYYSYQHNGIAQSLIPVAIGAGVTETYDVPYLISENGVACGEAAEAMILVGIDSDTDSDMSDNTASVTVDIAGQDCE
ncbi:MAG: hypothetical protein ACD_41C00178G0001 [uncultured bacterium]|nr:MAG: hypothetical protein ACD_41C00178G0001 [uncultured bacterium]HBY73270.1 hypothetical protein [Candidatus Kerfeldbacteria bacterium]